MNITSAGGLDSYLFNIDVNTGVVSFDGVFDYNNPTDVGRDNVYDINVLAIDWTGQSDTQAISITVQSDEMPEPFGLANDPNISVNEGETAVCRSQRDRGLLMASMKTLA